MAIARERLSTAFATTFKKDDRKRVSLDLNDLIGKTIALVRDDLEKHRIQVEAELDENLPPVAR